jgi:hypothetical protein
LLARIVARHPFVADVLALLGPMPTLTIGLVLAGFALGASISILDGPRHINVLAIPVGGVVLWNLAVYAWILFVRVRRRPPAAPTKWLAAAVSRPASRLVSGSRVFNAQLAEALQGFMAQWLEASKPLLIARATTAFHLAAAALGAGIIASLYVRGVAFDYRAVWESTFLDADQARAVLAILYGPASWLTGIPVPSTAELEAARWRADAAAWRRARRSLDPPDRGHRAHLRDRAATRARAGVGIEGHAPRIARARARRAAGLLSAARSPRSRARSRAPPRSSCRTRASSPRLRSRTSSPGCRARRAVP